jgi:hypothetical protein
MESRDKSDIRAPLIGLQDHGYRQEPGTLRRWQETVAKLHHFLR